MSSEPRTKPTDSYRRSAELAARPVLARLPDVSADVQLLRTEPRATGNVGYRFDPPQGAERGNSPMFAERTPRFPTLKSELIYAPRAARVHQPHVFERDRQNRNVARTPRRESPILPRTNPFANPRPGLLDTLAPFLRFATLVALFTAAGLWIQTVAFRPTPRVQPTDPPRATAQEPRNSNTKTAERPDGTSTSAIGPLRTTPEENSHLGRERNGEIYARLRGDILPAENAVEERLPVIPGLTTIAGELPRVQVGESPQSATDSPALTDRTTETTEVASVPGFYSGARQSR